MSVTCIGLYISSIMYKGQDRVSHRGMAIGHEADFLIIFQKSACIYKLIKTQLSICYLHENTGSYISYAILIINFGKSIVLEVIVKWSCIIYLSETFLESCFCPNLYRFIFHDGLVISI